MSWPPAVLLKTGFYYAAWSSVDKAVLKLTKIWLPAPNAGNKERHVPLGPAMQFLRHHLRSCSKMQRWPFLVALIPMFYETFSRSSAGSANLWPQKGWLHCVSEKSLLSIGWELILGDSHNSGSVPSWQLACRWVGCSFNQAQALRAGSVAPPLSPIPTASQSRNPFPRNCWRIPRLSGWSSLMSVSFPKALNLPKTAHMKQKWLSSPRTSQSLFSSTHTPPLVLTGERVW